jgi:hypothetical protein
MCRQYQLAQLVEASTATEPLQTFQSPRDRTWGLGDNESCSHQRYGAIDQRPYQARGHDTRAEG